MSAGEGVADTVQEGARRGASRLRVGAAATGGRGRSGGIKGDRGNILRSRRVVPDRESGRLDLSYVTVFPFFTIDHLITYKSKQ